MGSIISLPNIFNDSGLAKKALSQLQRVFLASGSMWMPEFSNDKG